MNNAPWLAIFDSLNMHNHDFSKSPFLISAESIKQATKLFEKTGEREVRVLCKQDSRDKRPEVFIKNDLFILPVKNGYYSIIKGEGYVDIPEIIAEPFVYDSKLDFRLETSLVGDSEMQHLDFAYATSLIRTFVGEQSLVLTIRGRKYTPKFSFIAGYHKQELTAESVQTEIDAGYEGKNNVVLIEAKNTTSQNVIIRQLYYPFRQWSEHTRKKITLIFFEKRNSEYCLWQYGFENKMDYNSIYLVNSGRYLIQ